MDGAHETPRRPHPRRGSGLRPLSPPRRPLRCSHSMMALVRLRTPRRRCISDRTEELMPRLGMTRQVLSAVFLTAMLAGVARSQSTARTVNGAVQGVVLATGVALFKGIPFAAPPIGDRRWKPPQAVANWQGVRDAT